jgi:hypothetical protein
VNPENLGGAAQIAMSSAMATMEVRPPTRVSGAPLGVSSPAQGSERWDAAE